MPRAARVIAGYTVQKTGALWQVLDAAGRVQFTSLRRINCTDFVRQITGDTTPET